MDARTTTLFKLHSDTLISEMAKPDNLDTRSVINVSLANKYTYQLFKPTLLQRLKKYIARSAKKQVEGLLKIHFNFDANHLVDLCQRVLLVGDIDLLKIITKEREDVLKQIELPKKLIDETNTYDFSAVIAAIESGKNVEEVLAKMRTDLDTIVKEKGFPFQAMINAYDIYDKKFDLWTYEKCKVFSIKVIGYLQRLAPAWLKKLLATGIHFTEEGNDTFILRSGESIDPDINVPNSGLGFDFCVNIYGLVAGSSWRPYGGATLLKSHLGQKQQILVSLCRDSQKALLFPK